MGGEKTWKTGPALPPLKSKWGGSSSPATRTCDSSAPTQNDVQAEPKPCSSKTPQSTEGKPETDAQNTTTGSPPGYRRLRKLLDARKEEISRSEAQHRKKLLAEEQERESQEALNRYLGLMFEKPMDVKDIKKIVTTPISAAVLHEKYNQKYLDDKAQCGGRDYFIPLIQYARISQLAECFPYGVAVNYLLNLYRRLVGHELKLEGYSFPKDDESLSKYKLRSILWIPDNDAHYLPERIVFPVESFEKYGGSLRNLLEIYWDFLFKYMEDRKVVNLTETFSADYEAGFFALTRIPVSCQRWGLFSYSQFIRALVDNFDPENEKFSILDLPSELDGIFKQDVFLVTSGENGDHARDFERAVKTNFCWAGRDVPERCPTPEPPPPPRPTEKIAWDYGHMNFEAVKSIQEEPDDYRVHEVIAAGNIWDFYRFHVIFLKDVKRRDDLLVKIDYLVKKNEEYTVPEAVRAKSLVIFMNARESMWRRGLVIRQNKIDGTLEILDIDTGETNIKVPSETLRNFTPELFHVPVLTIPVRFSLSELQKELFMWKPEANRVLGKYLHMILVEANKGLQLKFHWWDEAYTSYTPGVWVVSGYLIDVLHVRHSIPIRPRVCIATYLLDKYEKRDPKEELPEWPERNPSEEDDWNIAVMRPRLPNIIHMMNRHVEMKSEKKRSWYIPEDTRLELQIDKNLEDVPVDKILKDAEGGGALGREQPKTKPKWKGLRKGKSLIKLGGKEEKAVCENPGNSQKKKEGSTRNIGIKRLPYVVECEGDFDIDKIKELVELMRKLDEDDTEKTGIQFYIRKV